MRIKLPGRNGVRPESAPSEGEVCQHCGHHATKGEHFCAECGHQLTRIVLPSGVSPAGTRPVGEDPGSAPTTEIHRHFPWDPLRRWHTADGQTATAETEVTAGTADGAGEGSLPHRLVSWLGRRRLFVIVLLALLIAGGIAYLLFRPTSTAPGETRDALTAATSAANRSTQAATQARLVVDVRNAGRKASDSLTTIDGQRAVVSDISDERYRAAATGLLVAESAYVGDLARLARLDLNNPMPVWGHVEPRLKRESLAIQQAIPAVEDLGLADQQQLIPSIPAINGAIAALDGLINHAAQRLGKWQTELARAQASQANDLSVANSYGNTMRGYLAQYDDLRDETSQWITKVDTQGATFDEAYEFLGSGAAARQNLQRSIRGLSAPDPVAPAQSEIETVLGKGEQAMYSAASGIATFQFDSSYTDYKQTPGWQQFESASDEISSEYASARSHWEAALSDYISATKSRPMPERPNV